MTNVRIMGAAAGAAMAILCLAAPAMAFGPPPSYGPGPGLGMRPFDGADRQGAVRAARSEGLDRIEEISTRGPHWVLKGFDRDRQDMTVVVDGRTNDVVAVRHYF